MGHSSTDGGHSYFAKKSDILIETKPDMFFPHIVGKRGAYVRSSEFKQNLCVALNRYKGNFVLIINDNFRLPC